MGVLSAIPFTVYIDELLSRLTAASLGCDIGNILCVVLECAKHITRLAPTPTGLQFGLNIYHQFAEAYDVTFNSSKSKLLFVGR